ncbi:MAG: hypothetical protein DSM107014_07105 [Gomphosphaeria aponina SAG 52.96 = DSM 107014]|uniref:Uncharacterized protein n=1 Tax=Gomphosphaeria aponina SAG 52.96 = DSM 107014 TaxID=1521640 RepID=A0A941GNZ3_9CHRO|nr:hypothetical protein [Gomphosphaeria aponina SAG 52.96 = DSM 107014]
MRPLTFDEIVKIEEIVIQYFQACERPGEHLKALIRISEIQIDIADQYFTTNVKELIADFYSKIVDEQDNLRRFLRVLEYKLSENSDERLRVQQCIEKLGRSQPSESTSRSDEHKQLLKQERRASFAQGSNTQQPIKIDNDIIIHYDLDTLESEFKLGYQGIFAFTIVGDDSILRNYIIKRIIKELDAKRTCRSPRNIYLSDMYETIEEEINSTDSNIVSLLNDDDYLDTLLIIWNYSLHQDKISSMASSFLNQIRQKYSQYLKNKRRCLIIILANVSTPCQPNGYNPITVPEKFNIDELSDWFYRCLITYGIEEVMIEQYLNRLKGQKGDFIATYRIIEAIIDELQNKYERLFQ